MGLRRGKVQSISRAFIFCQEQMIKKHKRIKIKETYKQKRGKYLSRSRAYHVLDSGAYAIRREEKNH
jgi:hypothetical protein